MPLQAVAVPLPQTFENLTEWIRARLEEPCVNWAPRHRAAGLPTPVNLPGMERAVAALLARYRHASLEWLSDVMQDFLVYLLRTESVNTLARSAMAGVTTRKAGSLEEAIAWKLRMELLSRASRSYKRLRRDENLFVELPASGSRRDSDTGMAALSRIGQNRVNPCRVMS